MNSLLLGILCSSLFSHLMRFGHWRKSDMLWVGPANYWAAGVICAMAWAVEPRQDFTAAVLPGTVAGVALCCAYFLFNSAIKLAGVAISQAVSRLSVAIPMAASILVWGERPGLARSMGLGLALLAIPLLTHGRGLAGAGRGGAKAWFTARVHHSWRAVMASHEWILLGNFATIGIVGVAMKAYVRAVPGGAGAFLAIMFLAAAVGTQLVALVMAGRPAWPDLLLGAVLGLSNLFSNYGLMRALAVLPGTVVFTTFSAGVILVTTVSAAIIWRERYTRVALLGMLIAVVALVLINL